MFGFFHFKTFSYFYLIKADSLPLKSRLKEESLQLSCSGKQIRCAYASRTDCSAFGRSLMAQKLEQRSGTQVTTLCLSCVLLYIHHTKNATWHIVEIQEIFVFKSGRYAEVRYI